MRTNAAIRMLVARRRLLVGAMLSLAAVGSGLVLFGGGGDPSTSAGGRIGSAVERPGDSSSSSSSGTQAVPGAPEVRPGVEGTFSSTTTPKRTSTTARKPGTQPTVPTTAKVPGSSTPSTTGTVVVPGTPATPVKPGPRVTPNAPHSKGIWTAGANGSDRRLLVADPEAGTGGGPAWSADGTQFAFVAADRALWLVNADGSGRRLLATGPVDAGAANGTSASWGSDDQLAFASWDGSIGRVHVVQQDGSGARVVSPAGMPRITSLGFAHDGDLFFSDGKSLYKAVLGDCSDADLPLEQCEQRIGLKENGPVSIGPGQLSVGADGLSLLWAGGGRITLRDQIETVDLAQPGPVDSFSWAKRTFGYAWDSGNTVTIARTVPGDPRPPLPLVHVDKAASPTWLSAAPGQEHGPVIFITDGAGGGQAIAQVAPDGSGRHVLISFPAGLTVKMGQAANPDGDRIVYTLL
ncbi:MAG: TolB family protein [Acidimicrobiia bacterium]